MAFKKLLDKFKKKNEEFTFEETLIESNVITDQIAPDSIQIAENYVRSGNNYTRTLLCVDFESLLDYKDIAAISEISETITIVQYLDYYDSSKVDAELSRSIKQNTAKLNEPKLSPKAKEDAQAQIDSARMLLKQLVRTKERMFMFQYLIHIVASSMEELEAVSSRVKTTCASIGKFIYPITRSKDAFDSFLPIGKNKVYDLTYRAMNSEATAMFFPFHENEIFDENGIIQGKNIETNNIVVTNDSNYLNKHAVYIGSTGSGKSTAMFANMMRKYQFGERVIVIDPKGEFGEKFKRLNGEWVQFNLSGGSIINPFDLPEYSFEDKDGIVKNTNPLYEKVSTLITLFQLMYSDMTDLEADILSELLLELYEDDRFGKSITIDDDVSNLKREDYPIMADLYELLGEKEKKDPKVYEHLSNFHQTLRAYALGTYSKIFNGYTNVDVNSDLIAYDLFSVYNYPRLQKPLYFLLLSSLRNEIMNGDRRATQLYIDEAHIIADPKVTIAMQYLYEMMKVIRSFNCGVTTATQQIQDFLSAKDKNRNYGDAVISLSVQQLILPMQKKEVYFVAKEMHYDFSEDEIDYLEFQEVDKGKKAGKGFLFVGSRRIKMKVELTELEKKIWFNNDYSAFENAKGI